MPAKNKTPTLPNGIIIRSKPSIYQFQRQGILIEKISNYYYELLKNNISQIEKLKLNNTIYKKAIEIVQGDTRILLVKLISMIEIAIHNTPENLETLISLGYIIRERRRSLIQYKTITPTLLSLLKNNISFFKKQKRWAELYSPVSVYGIVKTYKYLLVIIYTTDKNGDIGIKINAFIYNNEKNRKILKDLGYKFINKSYYWVKMWDK